MAEISVIVVPDIGDYKNVPVVDVLVKVGDLIELEAPLITLETEKATMDVPATAAGRVVTVKLRKGDKVSQGAPIAEIAVSTATATATAQRPVPVVEARKEPSVRLPALAEPEPARGHEAAPAILDEVGFAKSYASPSVRLLARELGVDLAHVTGSGLKARITHADVKAYVKSVLSGERTGAAAAAAAFPKVPVVDFAKFGPIDVKPLGRIQRIAGPRLHASWVNIPHVTQFDEADITELEVLRGQLKIKAVRAGIKLTPLAFVLKACARAIAEFPLFASSLDASGQNLVLKKYVHLGFAADTPGGLVVPVIRDVDRKDLFDVARELATLSAKARDGKLTPAEMQGGVFTVSSLGSIGGTAFTPIINAPEVAILGVSRAAMKPVYQNGSFVPRLLLPLALSYDHRVIDGAMAVRFTSFLVEALNEARALTEALP